MKKLVFAVGILLWSGVSFADISDPTLMFSAPANYSELEKCILASLEDQSPHSLKEAFAAGSLEISEDSTEAHGIFGGRSGDEVFVYRVKFIAGENHKWEYFQAGQEIGVNVKLMSSKAKIFVEESSTFLFDLDLTSCE